MKSETLILVSDSGNIDRKYRYTLECLKSGLSWVCVNTARANELTRIVLENKLFKLPAYSRVIPEQSYDKHTRFDFFLEQKSEAGIYVEVKSVTLSLEKGIASFPDAVTQRGQKHLSMLMDAINNGFSAYLIFICMRGDCSSFKPADEIDPGYARLLKDAKAGGLKILCYGIKIRKSGFYLRKTPINLLGF